MKRYHEPGAYWLRCDLHVHTPFDPQRHFGENVQHAIDAFKKEKLQRLADIASRFIEACRKAAGGEGVDLIALTDHNSIEGYRYLKPQFDTIAQQAKDAGLSMPVILPGVEFSVGGERPLHFLVIFARDTLANDIDGAIRHVFGSKAPFNPRTGTPEATGHSVDDFLRKLYEWCRPTSDDRRLSFVILPAHADSDRGPEKETRGRELAVEISIWDEMRGHLRQWVLTRRDWNGFQTLQPYQKLPQAFQDLLARWVAARRDLDWEALTERDRRRIRETQHWPLIEASDPHRYEDIGTRFTWLKMEVPDVEGIRLGLLDPESRLRRMVDGKPGQAYPVIRRLAIRGTDFFEDFAILFNPCLNSLIGGRGSGKSTAIECLRYTLDRARAEDFEEDEREIRETVDRFLTRKRERDFGESPGMLLPGYEVEVELEVAARLYRVTRSERGVEVVSDPQGAGAQPGPLDVRTLMVPRILSQRQIARIARDHAAQRRELDAMAEAGLTRSFADRQRVLLEAFERLQATRRNLKERALTLPARDTELQKVRDQIEFLERGGNKEILDRFRACQTEQQWLKDALEGLEGTAGRLEVEATEADESRERLGAPPQGPASEWTRTVADRVNRRLSEVKTNLSMLAASLRDLAQDVEAERELRWSPGFREAEAAYQGLQRAMQEKGVEFRQHEPLLQRRALLEREVLELRGLTGQLERIEREIRDTRSALVGLREERLATRRDLADTLEKEDSDVRLEVLPFGDRKALAERRDEWSGGAGIQERDWEILVDFVFSADGTVPDRLLDLVSALRRDMEATKERGRVLESSDSAVASLLGSATGRLTRNFYNALQRGERIQLDAMERFLPEDWVIARVRDAHGTFKPIEQGSIGLKSTAVLSLLLAAGDQPLIIDQPEDDLDNQYIYDVVVGLLRKRKFSRQIIIATHNANIPVNGDAELIVALGVEDRFGKVQVLGSIDRREVKDAVSTIMEGSAEAFRLRRERYGY